MFIGSGDFDDTETDDQEFFDWGLEDEDDEKTSVVESSTSPPSSTTLQPKTQATTLSSTTSSIPTTTINATQTDHFFNKTPGTTGGSSSTGITLTHGNDTIITDVENKSVISAENINKSGNNITLFLNNSQN